MNKPTIRLLPIGIFVLFNAFGVVPIELAQEQAAVDKGEIKSTRECLEQFKGLPYWTYDADGPKDFSKTQWMQYVKCAKAFQLLAEKDRLSVLVDFQKYATKNRTNDKKTGFTQYKALLLLRVALAVSKKPGVVPMNGLVGAPRDNPLWPLEVASDGHLKLMANFRGGMGPPYSPVEDYNELRKHFGWRDLSALGQ
jgi:hypothetical protein